MPHEMPTSIKDAQPPFQPPTLAQSCTYVQGPTGIPKIPQNPHAKRAKQDMQWLPYAAATSHALTTF